jgi:DNA-binding winged helix-turn-helix (wHTH) protein/Tfp pilus assembly protein PilF
MSPREYAHRVYRFGDFGLDLDRGTLYCGEDEVHLRPQAFAVLRVLLENRGQLVTKNQLHDTVWEGSVVTDDSLAHCVADIRRAFGECGFKLIRTVPRRGYVFDHPVIREMADPVESKPDRRPRLYHQGAGAAILVAAALLGFGARQGGIPETEAGNDPQSEAVLLPISSSTADVGAHNDHAKGLFFFKRRAEGDLTLAEKHFKAALERDASFAGAWIGLAGVYSVRLGQGDMSPDEALPLLGDATRHAIALAPGSAEAHIRRATYHRGNGEMRLAREHIEKAVALEPEDVLVLGRLAGHLAHRGRLDEAIEMQYRAVRRDPTSALQYHNLIWYLLAAGRTAEAAKEAEQYRAIKPQAVTEADSLFADILILQGNFEQALIVTRNMANGPMRHRDLAIIHYALGQYAQAEKALAALASGDYVAGDIHIAEVLAQRGQLDGAAGWLTAFLGSPEQDSTTGHQAVWLLSPFLIELRSDARWQALFSQVLAAHGDSLFLASAAF